MSQFEKILNNKILFCAIAAWLLAQFIKFIIGIIQNKKFDFRLLYTSGGMPSSHSSTVCALATGTGIVYGFDGVEFAIAAILAVVVMYDAAGIRRAAGEQAKILNRIMDDLEEGNQIDFNIHLKEFLGHTPFQVLMGALLGIALPVIAFTIVFSV